MKQNLIKNLLLLLLFGATFLNPAIAYDFPKFKDGDIVCFIGNSITHGGAYHAFLQIFCATRFPDAEVEYYNCGIAGDVANGMIRRLDEDVLTHQPDYAFIMTGMNDVQRGLYSRAEADQETLDQRQKALENYYVKTEEMVKMLMENNVRIILMTPSIYDQTAKIKQFNDYGTNDALALCAEHIRNMAKKYDTPLVDLHAAMSAINLKGQIDDSSFTIVGLDRIHPGTSGHFVMAYQILNSIMPSQYVSKMALNARKKEVEESLNCTIKIESHGVLEFMVLENSLPFPVNKRMEEALDLVPFQEDLNKEMLIIADLAEGNYNLLIDEKEVGIFSSQELKTGINLSNNPLTPQYKQAEMVSNLCLEYHKVQDDLRSIAFIDYRMLQNYDGPETVAGKRTYLDAELEKQKGKSWHRWNAQQCDRYFETLPKEEFLWEELARIRGEIYSSNKPVGHSYKLKKVF
ncbi:SGNH/GDSL hydrolase family protein [Bacteroidota bacterium]